MAELIASFSRNGLVHSKSCRSVRRVILDLLVRSYVRAAMAELWMPSHICLQFQHYTGIRGCGSSKLYVDNSYNSGKIVSDGFRLLKVRDESRLACASCVSRLTAGAVQN
jgi:hypothetical protein